MVFVALIKKIIPCASWLLRLESQTILVVLMLIKMAVSKEIVVSIICSAKALEFELNAPILPNMDKFELCN